MNTSMKEDEMLNCPDCQLQTLQQQQQQQQNQFPGPGVHHPHLQVNSIQPPKDHSQLFQNSRNLLNCDLQNQMDLNSARSNSVGVNVAYQSKGHQISVSGIPYKNSDGSATHGASSCNTVSNTMSIVPVPMLSGSNPNSAALNSADMLPNNNPCLTPLPMDGCDISGYCATCAVLDLPTNDKYYRPSLPRHSVFPPMFYGQAPPIPGFSPIPDCNIWGNCNSNDFGYSYPTYPQQTSSNDYYGTSANTVLPSIHSPSDTSNQPHLMSSCSFSFSSNSLANVLDGSECFKKSNLPPESANNGKKTQFIEHSNEDDDDRVIPICISSSSEDTSDSGSFISQREVIVEDEDDDDSASMSMCHMDGSQKCTICQNPVLDCPSPQLANILENIHEDITAEDLDITVSSGDIEIGGIEDEVRDFHPKKSSLQNGPQIPLSRLAYLLNIPLEILVTLNKNSSMSNSQSSGHDQDIHVDPLTQTAILCSKCSKLAATIDSLEKQLRNTCTVLKEFFQPQILLQSQPQNKSEVHPMNNNVVDCLQKTQTMSSEACKNVLPPCHTTNEENNASSVDPQKSSKSCYPMKKTDCKLTQTEFLFPIPAPTEASEKCVNGSNDCIAFANTKNDATTICTSLFQCVRVRPTCTKDTMTDCDANITVCSASAKVSAVASVEDHTGIPIDSRGREGHHAQDSNSKAVPVKMNVTEKVQASFHQMSLNFAGTSSTFNPDDDQDSDSENSTSTSSSQDSENFESTADSPIANMNLECDIHDINCSFIPELRRDEEEKELEPHLIFPVDQSQGQAQGEGIIEYGATTVASASSDTILGNDLDLQFDSYLCEECGRILSSRRTFETHVKRHRNDFVHKCRDCGKGFVNEASLQIHVRTHTGEKPFPCSRCGKSFATKSNMVSHQDICKEYTSDKSKSKSNCNPMGGESRKNPTIISPLKVAGNTNRESCVKLYCPTCGLCFRLKERLENHLLKGCTSKVLECSHCQKKFSKHSEMKVHMLIHNGEKPYVCNVCGISFATKGNQISHSRTHSLDKRFKCEICDKGFNRKQALQLHFNRHNGIKPFTCSICERKFYDPSNLQNHKKIHNKKNT